MKYYLDKNQIERMASNRTVYQNGAKLYADDLVGELEFSPDGERTRVFTTVRDNSDEMLVGIVFDGAGLLQKYSCSCNAFGVWRGGCEHVTAAFLKVFDHSRQVARVSRGIRASKQLLDQLEKKTLENIDKSIQSNLNPVSPIRLSPTLGVDYSGAPQVALEIGVGRMYVVKSVDSLLAAFETEETVSYGKNLSFKHSLNTLDKQSRRLANLLIDEKRQADRIIKAYGGVRMNRAVSERACTLSPAGMDGLFDIYIETEINADKDWLPKNRDSLRLTSQPSGPLFRIARQDLRQGNDGGDDGGVNQMLSLAWIGSEAVFIRGESRGYIIADGIMRSLGLDVYDILRQIKRVMESVGSLVLTFDNKDAGRLASYLLPPLREVGLILEEVNIPEALTSPVSPRAYLDAENGVVSCIPAFVYDGVEVEPSDEGTVAARDIPGEYAFLRTLEQMGFTKEVVGGLYVISSDDVIYDFYYGENGLASLRETAEVFATDAFAKVSRKAVKTPVFGLRLSGDLLEMRVDLDGYTTAELLEVLEAYRLKKQYHKLKDGSVVDLAGEGRETLETLDGLFAGLGVTSKELAGDTITLPKYRAVFAAAALGKEDSAEPGFGEGVEKLVSDMAAFRKLDFPLPASLDQILRGYQKEGFRWLMTLASYGFGGILADDMGLGKTIQVISLLQAYAEEDGPKLPSLVVAPTSLIYNWEKEIARFAPSLKSVIISGPAERRRAELLGEKGAAVFITTYDTLKRDVDHYKGVNFRFVIADEAQNIKNPGTQNAKAVKSINGQVRLAMTGTPIENSLSELWSIFDFILPGYLFSANRFSKLYETPIIKNNDKNAAANLRKQISPFILRRLKSDVLSELPEKMETTLYADMTEEQRKVYTAYMLKAQGELETTIRANALNENRIEILSMLTRLRQICCHPATFIDGYLGGSGKLELTAETVTASLESGHRLLIFSQFTKMLSILMERLDADGVKYFYLDGATPSKERLAMTEAFNDGENEVFLISLKAGGAGLNLTGADVVIHYDPWWNPAVMSQASDRAHRYGQKRTVQVINIVAKDTIEEKIITLQARKKDLVDAVIEEGASFINKLSQDELLELFHM